MFTEASLDSLFGLWCSDYVYHGKNEKDILAGRQSAVEEILWCVIHATLEGQQSTGQAEQRPPFLKCHRGWEHSSLPGPDQVSSVSGMKWSAKLGQVSDARLFLNATQSRPGSLQFPIFFLWPFCYQLCQESITLDLKVTERTFYFSFILIQSSSFLFHSSATCISKIGVRVLDLTAVSFEQAIHCQALVILTALTCQVTYALCFVSKI